MRGPKVPDASWPGQEGFESQALLFILCYKLSLGINNSRWGNLIPEEQDVKKKNRKRLMLYCLT